jgi:nucleoside-diphosphate-sugar epimerase
VILQGLADMGRNTSFLNMDTALSRDVNAYTLSKHQFAEWGRVFAAHRAATLSFVNLRLQHLYGPGDDRSKFTSYVLHSCHENQPTLGLTAGDQMRDFVYIDDAVAALTLIAERRATFGATADIEVGSGAAHSIREFALAARRLTYSTTHLDFGAIPYRASEVMHCVADITALSALGWRPEFDLESGLRRYISLEFPPRLHPAGA